MFGKDIRDGDLPPGVYERDPITGALVPTTKILTNDPPRPLHVSAAGKITDISRQIITEMQDIVENHYEQRARIKGADTMVKKNKIRDMVNRAADVVMEGNR